ncbi:uncharacterized protein LOC143028732 [Oratosquilla oratoria]|uniref:uncharacterized protein LOC143028732 n=1 Tax=Oratosquilla oratoria TaxID=337810 RepID=UPI003F76AEE4
MKQLMDVLSQNSEIRKKMELTRGVKMGEMEWAFLEDQRTQKKMYCEDFVDRKGMKTMERRGRDIQSLERMRAECEKDKEIYQLYPLRTANSLILKMLARTHTISTLFAGSHISAEEGEVPSVKKRRTATDTVTQQYDELPRRYQHIRESIRKDQPEFYQTFD